MIKLLAIMLLWTTILSAAEPRFCAGWEDGYTKGWCSGDAGCVLWVPQCPDPSAGSDGYPDGYEAGLLRGMNARMAADAAELAAADAETYTLPEPSWWDVGVKGILQKFRSAFGL